MKFMLFILSFPCFCFVIDEELMKHAKEEKTITQSEQVTLSFYSINFQDPNNKFYVIVKKIHDKRDLNLIKEELCSGEKIFKKQDFANTYAVLDMNNEIWFIMEPILGADLRTVLMHIPEENLDNAFRYYVAAVAVKNYLLEKLGIKWGDEHPGNVMVDGFSGQVKLIDFGLSEKLNPSNKSGAYRRIGRYNLDLLTPEGNLRWNKLSTSKDRDDALEYLSSSDFKIKEFRNLAWFKRFSFEDINLLYFPRSAIKEENWIFYNTIKDKIVTPNMVDRFYRSSSLVHINCSG